MTTENRCDALEKQITELKKVCQDLSDKFDYQVKQVMKLEKENAELEKACKEIINKLIALNRKEWIYSDVR